LEEKMGLASLPPVDTWVLLVPILAIFAMGMFGLDERFVNKGAPRHRRSFCDVRGEGRFLSDPDGKPWRKLPPRQIEARIIHSPASGRMESRFKGPRPLSPRTVVSSGIYIQDK
jgi:hypothetical protein